MFFFVFFFFAVILVLAAFAWIDWRSYQVPVWFVALAATVFGGWSVLLGRMNGPSLLMGILFGVLVPLALFFLSKRRWIGSGDIWFGGLMGAILGFPRIVTGFWAAFLFGGLLAILLLLMKKKMPRPSRGAGLIPYIPLLAIGTIVGLFFNFSI
jgi:Flp pilus assembly protein protease CpaA